MPNETVLVTGSNGAIGYVVLLHALRAGFNVRAAVRSQVKADLILNGPSIKALDPSTKARLSFVIIPDILNPSAYDEALQSVRYVLHIASPMPSNGGDDFEASIIQPAIRGTMNILEATERTETVKRVVITSSVAAQIPFETFAAETIPGIFTENSRASDPVGPYKVELQAYLASKVLALNAAERWKKEAPRRIEVVHVHPSFVLGRVELANTEEEMLGGSSGLPLSMMLNKPRIHVMASNTCWIEDVAEVHVRALNDNIPDGQSLVVQGDAPEGIVWSDGKKILEEKFPKAIGKGVLPNGGWAKTKVWRWDISKTERLTGMKFQGFEKQITEIAKQYLEYVGEEVA